VRSAHDVSEGGLAITLAECCAATDDPAAMVGACAALPEEDEGLAAALFGEAPSRIVVSTRPEDVAEVARSAEAAGVPLTVLGTTGGARLTMTRGGRVVADVGLPALREARERCLEGIVGR
jgi:phosphoribosylformylglycinamidine synthase